MQGLNLLGIQKPVTVQASLNMVRNVNLGEMLWMLS